MKASHRNTLESIPWLVTGRLSDNERREFERHVSECAECREELELQQRVHAAMTQETSRVDYAPGASLQKLWTRIGDAEVAAAPSLASKARSAAFRGVRPRFTQWLAAAVVIEAIGITFMAVRTSHPAVANVPPPLYSTVTTTEVIPHTAVLRVVFAADFSIGDMNSLLRTEQLVIVGGPSPNGVYTLATTAATQDLPTTFPATLASLRTHHGVRLAVPIGRATEKDLENRP
jgi:hypothetical protein